MLVVFSNQNEHASSGIWNGGPCETNLTLADRTLSDTI